MLRKRTQPEPVYLKIAQDHRWDCGGEEVVRQLQSDFRNKCYLCEQTLLTSLEIEHFQPHMGRIELIYDWNNLFFACEHL